MQEHRRTGTSLITRAAIVGIMAGALTGTAVVLVADGYRKQQQRLECPSVPLHEPIATTANKDGSHDCWFVKGRYAIGAHIRVRIGPLP